MNIFIAMENEAQQRNLSICDFCIKTFTNVKNRREKAFIFVQKFKSLIISVPGFLVSYFQSFVLAFQRTTFKKLYVVQKLTTAGNSMIALEVFSWLFKGKACFLKSIQSESK